MFGFCKEKVPVEKQRLENAVKIHHYLRGEAVS
jgi:hypothetical protein